MFPGANSNDNGSAVTSELSACGVLSAQQARLDVIINMLAG